MTLIRDMVERMVALMAVTPSLDADNTVGGGSSTSGFASGFSNGFH